MSSEPSVMICRSPSLKAKIGDKSWARKSAVMIISPGTGEDADSFLVPGSSRVDSVAWNKNRTQVFFNLKCQFNVKLNLTQRSKNKSASTTNYLRSHGRSQFLHDNSDWSLGGTVSHLVSVQGNRLSVNNDVVWIRHTLLGGNKRILKWNIQRDIVCGRHRNKTYLTEARYYYFELLPNTNY